MKVTIGFMLCALIGFSSFLDAAETERIDPGQDDEYIIAHRPISSVSPIRPMYTPHGWLEEHLSAAAYQADAAEAAMLLGKNEQNSVDYEAIVQGISRDQERAGKAFVNCLDWRIFKNKTLRLGAVAGLRIAHPSAPSTGNGLANSALAEPNKQVRAAAIELIKERKDSTASLALLNFLNQAHDEDNLIVDEALRDAAIAAMHDVGDKHVLEVLLYNATLELRLGVSKLNSIGRATITGAGGINLPIDLPNLELSSFNGVITVPAPAFPILARVSGQNFGKNVDKWDAWIKERPDFNK